MQSSKNNKQFTFVAENIQELAWQLVSSLYLNYALFIIWILIRLFRQEFRETPYESCCVIFKDKINAMEFYDAICCYASNIELFLEICFQAILNSGVGIHTTSKIYKQVVPFKIWFFQDIINTFPWKTMVLNKLHRIKVLSAVIICA